MRIKLMAVFVCLIALSKFGLAQRSDVGISDPWLNLPGHRAWILIGVIQDQNQFRTAANFEQIEGQPNPLGKDGSLLGVMPQKGNLLRVMSHAAAQLLILDYKKTGELLADSSPITRQKIDLTDYIGDLLKPGTLLRVRRVEVDTVGFGGLRSIWAQVSPANDSQ